MAAPSAIELGMPLLLRTVFTLLVVELLFVVEFSLVTLFMTVPPPLVLVGAPPLGGGGGVCELGAGCHGAAGPVYGGGVVLPEVPLGGGGVGLLQTGTLPVGGGGTGVPLVVYLGAPAGVV